MMSKAYIYVKKGDYDTICARVNVAVGSLKIFSV